jgi:hypothetical protein
LNEVLVSDLSERVELAAKEFDFGGGHDLEGESSLSNDVMDAVDAAYRPLPD